MSQGVLHNNAVVRVECQHLVQQVERLGVRVGVQPRPGHFGLERQRLQVAAGLLVDDALQILWRRGAQDTQDVVQLVQIVLAGEDRPVAQHLCQDAAHAPDVY